MEDPNGRPLPEVPPGAPANNPAPSLPPVGSSGRVALALRWLTPDQTDAGAVKEFQEYITWVTQAGVNKLVDGLFQGSSPTMFLTVIDEMVTVAHYFGHYSNELGRPLTIAPPRCTNHQRMYLLVGELVLDQMAIWRGPATEGNRIQDWMTASQIVVPTLDEVAGAGEGLLPPLVPTEGRPANPVPKLLFIPKAWAEYVLVYRSKVEATEWITNKLATLMEEERQAMAPMDWWARALFVHALDSPEEPALLARWQGPPPDPVLLQFMRDRMKTLLPHEQPPPPSPGSYPMPTINVVTPNTTPEKERRLAEGEKARIRAACSLKTAEFEGSTPPRSTKIG